MKNPNFPNAECIHLAPHRTCATCRRKVGGDTGIEYITKGLSTEILGDSSFPTFSTCSGHYCFDCMGYVRR